MISFHYVIDLTDQKWWNVANVRYLEIFIWHVYLISIKWKEKKRYESFRSYMTLQLILRFFLNTSIPSHVGTFSLSQNLSIIDSISTLSSLLQVAEFQYHCHVVSLSSLLPLVFNLNLWCVSLYRGSPSSACNDGKTTSSTD